MKILHVINNIDRGGAETLLLNIIAGLKEKDNNYSVSVLILEDKQYLGALFEKAGINVVCLDILYKYSYLKKLVRVTSFIKKMKPDVVHSHLLKTDRIALPAAFFAGVKKRVCSIHNMEINRGKIDKFTRIISSLFATKLVAVSESARLFCIENNLYPEKKLKTIFNAPGFSAASVSAHKDKSHPLNIVNVARLQEQKGQIYLIQAMSILGKKNIECHLTIYGDGPERFSLKKEMDRLELKNVTLFGLTDDVPSVLEDADLFIAPSLWEGLPLSQIESIMMGVPLVATDIEPHKEILNQLEEYPYLVPVKSPEAIAEKIEMVINLTDTEYQALSEMSIRLSEKFSINNMIQNYDNFYKGL